MASMDLANIIRELDQRFAQPLPEFYKRRIIVWHDAEQEFSDKLEEIELNNAKKLVLTDKNKFSIKRLLNVDDITSNYLLYCPLSYASSADNWFLDMELYSEEFSADLVSIWMQELNVAQVPALRMTFKKYKKFFKAQGRREKIKAQNKIPNTPAQLQLAIMAVLAKVKEPDAAEIIRAMLEAGLETEQNPVYREFVNYDIADVFWIMVAQGTGYQSETPSLADLATLMLLTASTRTLNENFLAGINKEKFISAPYQGFCYDFVSEWLHSENATSFYKIAKYVESTQMLPRILRKVPAGQLINSEIFPCTNEAILLNLIEAINDNIIDSETIEQIVEKRRTCAWYEDSKGYFEAALQFARMRAFTKKHSAGFHIMDAGKLWHAYTDEYYVMDRYYRYFHLYYDKILKKYNSVLNDPFLKVVDIVERLYVDGFLAKLGDNWSMVCEDNLRDKGYVDAIPRQTDFYMSKVEGSETKTYVLVSDALRYEVAASLAEQLRSETQAEVKLTSMQGILPTITKFGMAALLPRREKLSLVLKPGKDDRLAVLVNGESSESAHRENILRSKNNNSVALKYKDIIGMKRAERQNLVKGMSVVYIYHDTIDEAGHTESSIFAACEAAIAELKNMVRIIANEFGGTKILITSDHGFLYTYKPLKEFEKINKTTGKDQDIEVGRRYVIVKKGAEPEHMLPFKLLDGNTEYAGFAPRGNIRIKKQGGGLKFVHGGISLEEMVVPLIDYHFLRNVSKDYRKNKYKYDTEPVRIALYSAVRKITNLIFSLNFYQTEALSANRVKAKYDLYFVDSNGNRISDTSVIIADKTSANAQERTFKCNFNLKSQKYNKEETYYLVISNEDGSVVDRIEFEINNAFAMDNFGFFS